jgi:ABC-type Na+ efflux pump permease subunit
MPKIIKDVIFSLIVSISTAGILAAGIGTLAAMVGWIEDNQVLVDIFLVIAVPLFVLSFILISRSSNNVSKNDT